MRATGPALAAVALALLSPTAAPAVSAQECLVVAGYHERCEAWTATCDDGSGPLDFAAAAAASPDGGRVFVTGSNYVPGQLHPMFDSTTIAYDAATGQRLWEHRYDQVPDTWDQMHDIAVSPDGAVVFVTGLGGLDFRGGGDFVVLAYDASAGEPVWEGRYDGGAIDEALALTVAPAGDVVYVTGVSVGDGTNRDYATAAFDADTGALRWSARYDGPASGVDQPVSVAVSPDGERVFVTGWSAGEAGDAYATIAYEAADPGRLGEQLWVTRYEEPGAENRPAALAVEATRVFVTGSSRTDDGRVEAATVAYDAANGKAVWEARLAGDDGAEATAMALDPAGDRLYVGGSAATGVAGVESRDIVVAAYDPATGSRMWLARHGVTGLTFDRAVALGIHPAGGEVYVAGHGSPVLEFARPGYSTIAFGAADGAQLWVARYGSGQPAQLDLPAGVAVAPTGDRLFLTGASLTSINPFAPESVYLTVAYDLTGDAAGLYPLDR